MLTKFIQCLFHLNAGLNVIDKTFIVTILVQLDPLSSVTWKCQNLPYYQLTVYILYTLQFDFTKLIFRRSGESFFISL